MDAAGARSATKTPDQAKALVSLLAVAGREFEGRYLWHRTRDRYVLFLAEFFLRRSNRTTVERFLPAFLERFPSANALAAATPDEAVAAAGWAGLRRRTASLPEVIARFQEREEWTAAELRTLPHIGAYAADGVALYVFGEPTFPLDGNVRRVVGRSLGTDGEDALEEAIDSVASEALTTGGVNNLRYVHMGTLALGWDHCRTKPSCASCPLFGICVSRSAFAG